MFQFRFAQTVFIVICLLTKYSLPNIEEEYNKVYRKLEYKRGVYGNVDKHADILYDYQGVSNNFRLYIDNTNNEQELVLWNLDENWQENRLRINKRVQEFWGYVNNFGIFIIYKRSNNIYWKIYTVNDGKELVGGFLQSENNLYLKLKDTYFADYKKGVFTSLIFYDNLGKQSYYIYYLDIWGRHDLVTKR